ncbi:MAG: hypothetical protein CSA52_02740 [Gammaproteobacteria bacterium]|nr:MAG: hypothetical protein CSB48_04410 [Pseudomonadota bacterium]PIE38317.1 MAG: hypothetical protein CSA52_02740 [Gammaproteobacteria bacterium]
MTSLAKRTTRPMPNLSAPLFSPVRLTLVSIGLLVLSACSKTSDRAAGPECYNPAVAVLLDRGTATTRTRLEQTQFDDFLKGYQPANAELPSEESALILLLEQKIRQATRFTGPAHAPESYSNSIDLIEEIIANDEVNNFTLARSQMEFAIENNIGCRYSNQNVKISYDDDGDGNLTTLNYLIDFNFVPVTSEGNEPFVSRTLVQFGAKSTTEDPNDTTDIFYSSAASITTYPVDTFTSFGYMTPKSVVASWSLSETESVTITKDYESKKQDSVEYTLSAGFALEGSDLTRFDELIKRVKFIARYAPGPDTTVDIFLSDFESALSGPNGEIVKDPTADELKQLQADYPDWVAEKYRDPGYDGDSPVPAFTYKGTSLPRRQ